MAWETRGRGSGPYYYFSKMVGGKVKRQYLGKGEQARQAAAQVAHARPNALHRPRPYKPQRHDSRLRMRPCKSSVNSPIF
jgi:hypothetical protein